MVILHSHLASISSFTFATYTECNVADGYTGKTVVAYAYLILILLSVQCNPAYISLEFTYMCIQFMHLVTVL